jgi:transcriptional regulator with XRE-family HTH domain
VARPRREIDPELQRAVIELRAAVAANVRALARRRGLSLNRLVDFAGVTRSAFYRALAGRGAMTVDTLAKLAVALDVGAAKLLEMRESSPRGRR